MLREVKVISASRAYAYDPDAIRLTMLVTSHVAGTIAKAFEFKDLELKAPLALFSRPKRTDPPGLVFTNGSSTRDDGRIVPVRSLSFSSDEITIVVAAPSACIDEVFERLMNLVASFDSPDGSRVIERFDAFQETSSISFRDDTFGKNLPMPALRSAAASASGYEWDSSVPFSMDFWFRPGGTPLEGPTPAHKFTLAARMRRSGELDTFRSIAPLPSERHIEYLEDVVQRL